MDHVQDRISLDEDRNQMTILQGANERFGRINGSSAQRTNVFCTSTAPELQINNPADLIDHLNARSDAREPVVCVIENISREYVEALGSAWCLNPSFFEDHATNPEVEDLWKKHDYPSQGRPLDPQAEISTHYDHFDGVFEYHDLEIAHDEALDSSPNRVYRHCFKKSPAPIQSNTRISYYRVYPWLYLFLVDAPLELLRKSFNKRTKSPPTLRFLYSLNRGGILLPQLLSQETYSLFASFKNFFQHRWHLNVLFHQDAGVLPAPPLIYLLCNSTQESNLRLLAKEIRRISFREIRKPDPKINAILHDKREDVARLKTEVDETIKYIPDEVYQYFRLHPYNTHPSSAWPLSPDVNLKRYLDEASKLETFLMETFQLLLSSIAIQDSQTSIKHAQRSTRLTQLAFIYIPLSFVTGIFGMNIKELNETGVPIWVCFVTISVVVSHTLVLFGLLRVFANWRATRNDESPKTEV